MKKCCKDRSNRVKVTPTKSQCDVCKRYHYFMKAEMGKLGATINALGRG